MNHLMPFALVVLVGIACNLPKSTDRKSDHQAPSPLASTPKPSQSPSPSPSPSKTADLGKRLLRVPELAGRSTNEVKRILGEPESIDKLNESDATGELSYDYTLENGTVFINFKKGKANYFHFEASESFDNFFPLGDAVGVDLRGVIPSSSGGGVTRYRDTTINGINFGEVRINSDGDYRIITLRID